MDISLIGKASYRKNIGEPAPATGTSANTKGAWAEMVSATPWDGFLELSLVSMSALQVYLVDIGIGAGGSEVVLIENMMFQMSYGVQYYSQNVFPTPLFIPAGTRIVARAQTTGTTSRQIYLVGTLTRIGGFGEQVGLSKSFTYGAVTATSRGTIIDPGGLADTKGAWVELTSSCQEVKGFNIMFGDQLHTDRVTCWWHADIGIGAEGSEVLIVEDEFLQANSLSDGVAPRNTAFIPISIPAGTRIAARTKCSSTDATRRKFDIVLVCFA
jgi:hypothetical protein